MGANPRFVNRQARSKTIARLRCEVESGRPCALCGRPIDLNRSQWFVDPKDGKRKRAPWSFEVDEIVPVSRGGLPYGENCQPVHRICNQRAGDKKPTKKKRIMCVVEKPKTSRKW